MATKKATTSRAAKMRAYYTANPTATPSEVAEKFKTTYQIAYMCKRKMKPKKLVLQLSEVEIANRLGISTAEYAKQKAKILKEPKMKRIAVFSSNKSVLDTINPEAAITMEEPQADPVNHPAHYKVGGIETIDFIEAKGLTYHLGNAVKYISRADHKGNRKQDLEKAKWYLERAIAQL
jgi:hypothetical protein